MISIHALREEGDNRVNHDLGNVPNFYPRPPRGGRPDVYALIQSRLDISIHALREEGDGQLHGQVHICWISIHALREEGDIALLGLHVRMLGISIHALREEGDSFSLGIFPPVSIFLSTPSARRATSSAGLNGDRYL